MSGVGQAIINAVETTRPRTTVGAILAWLGPVIVTGAVFKLAISDGGRDPASLTLAQVAIFLGLIVLILTGRARLGLGGAPMLAMSGLVALSGLWSVRPESSVRALLLWGMYLGVSVLTASTVSSRRAARMMIDALICVAGWLVLIALFMYWGASTPGMRWFSTFYWPNSFAAFLLLVLPTPCVRTLRAERPREALAYGAATVLLATALVLTYSRGAWVSAAAVLIAMVPVLRPRSWSQAARRAGLMALAVAVAVVLLLRGVTASSPADLLSRAASITDPGGTSVQGRLEFWRSALAAFLDHPVLGTGAGTFSAVHAVYQRDVRFYARDAHNLYLQTAAELGLIGFAALGALLIAIGAMWRAGLRRSQDHEGYTATAGIGLGLLGFFLHSGLDMDWFFPANPALAFALVGILAAAEGPATDELGRIRSRAVSLKLRAAAVIILSGAVVTSLAAGVAHQRFVRGQRQARAGQWAAALSLYAAAARWNPLSATYAGAEASAAAALVPPRWDRAGDALRRAMALDRLNSLHPMLLAQMLISRSGPGDTAEAERLLRHALALDPLNRPGAYLLLARLHLSRGEAKAAEEVYRGAVAQYRGRGLSRTMLHVLLWPEVARLHVEWARLVAGQGRGAEAAAILRALLEEDPFYPQGYLELADVLAAAGDLDGARGTLRNGVRLNPQSAELRDRLRAIEAGRSRVEGAGDRP